MEGENSIQPGAGSQVVGLSRWGDYSSMSMDPVGRLPHFGIRTNT